MKTFLVIPLHNEEKQIGKVLKDLFDIDLQIVVVDDGSKDNSQSIINNLQLKHKDITLLSHKVNLGKGAAMKTGADYAFQHGADSIVFMDADGQHNVKDIYKFLEKLNTGKYDLVFGSRNLNYGVPLVRYMGNKIASLVIRFLFGIYVSDPICGFRAITEKAYQKIRWESTGYGVETEILARVGKNKLKFTEVPVETIYYDKDKGVTIIDAFGVMGDVLKWRLTI
jgi:glycosyltransferase involved in cell wall biosynthesis